MSVQNNLTMRLASNIEKARYPGFVIVMMKSERQNAAKFKYAVAGHVTHQVSFLITHIIRNGTFCV